MYTICNSVHRMAAAQSPVHHNTTASLWQADDAKHAAHLHELQKAIAGFEGMHAHNQALDGCIGCLVATLNGCQALQAMSMCLYPDMLIFSAQIVSTLHDEL